MSLKRPSIDDGEWVQPRRTNFVLECCDCGLTHIVTFRIRNGRLYFKAHRDARKTAAVRRYKVRG